MSRSRRTRNEARCHLTKSFARTAYMSKQTSPSRKMFKELGSRSFRVAHVESIGDAEKYLVEFGRHRSVGPRFGRYARIRDGEAASNNSTPSFDCPAMRR